MEPRVQVSDETNSAVDGACNEAGVGQLEEEEEQGPPSPFIFQLMEIGFSRNAVEMAFKTLGLTTLFSFIFNKNSILILIQFFWNIRK